MLRLLGFTSFSAPPAFLTWCSRSPCCRGPWNRCNRRAPDRGSRSLARPPTSCVHFFANGVASPTVRRPFRARMATPSRMLSRISRAHGEVSSVADVGRDRRFRAVSSAVPSGSSNGEARAFAGGAGDVDAAAVRLDDPGDEAQAQAQALDRSWSARCARDKSGRKCAADSRRECPRRYPRPSMRPSAAHRRAHAAPAPIRPSGVYFTAFESRFDSSRSICVRSAWTAQPGFRSRGQRDVLFPRPESGIDPPHRGPPRPDRAAFSAAPVGRIRPATAAAARARCSKVSRRLRAR